MVKPKGKAHALTCLEGIILNIEEVKITYQDQEGFDSMILPLEAKGRPQI